MGEFNAEAMRQAQTGEIPAGEKESIERCVRRAVEGGKREAWVSTRTMSQPSMRAVEAWLTSAGFKHRGYTDQRENDFGIVVMW